MSEGTMGKGGKQSVPPTANEELERLRADLRTKAEQAEQALSYLKEMVLNDILDETALATVREILKGDEPPPLTCFDC